MAKLVWDKTGERFYETGVSNVALYPLSTLGAYDSGVAWSGVTAITESPSGAEPSPVYADNIKYLNLLSAEEFAATLEALSYPDEFEACNGRATLMEGVTVGQQTRKTFGLAYKTLKGNDTDGNDHGYILHLVYGCLAAPSEKAHNTVSDSPEPMTMSWSISTTPVSVSGMKPTATLDIDSTKTDALKLAALEAVLFGSAEPDGTPRLPLPDEVKTILEGAGAG